MMRLRFLVLLPAFAMAGCAGLGASRADRLLHDGRYDAAALEYASAEANAPPSATQLRNHGMALFFTERHEDAATRLQQAVLLDPFDLKARFFLARAYDAQGRAEDALRAYGVYVELGGKFSPAVRGRMEALIRERAARDIRLAVAREDSLSAVPPPENTLAVPEFLNVAGGETLDALAHGLAALTITDLSRVKRFRVLERGALQTIRAELRLAGRPDPASADTLGATPPPRFVDPATAPRLGRLLRARRFVQGYVVPLGETGVQLGAGIVDGLDGVETPAGEPINGTLEESTAMAKQLVYRVLVALGVEPSGEEREAIDRPATGSLDALLAFGRGVAHEKRGRIAEALASYRDALRHDPGFGEASSAEAWLAGRAAEVAAAEEAYASEAWSEGEAADPRRFLNRLVAGIGAGPPPDDPPGAEEGGGGAGDGSDETGGGIPVGTGDDYDITPIEIDKLVHTLPDFPDPPGASPVPRGGRR